MKIPIYRPIQRRVLMKKKNQIISYFMLFVMMAQVLAFNTPQTAKAEKTGGGGRNPLLDM